MDYNEQLQTEEWKEKRKEILKRDNNQCQRCFKRTKQLHVHHKIYKRGCFAWEYDNKHLLTLCSFCHEELHRLIENSDFVNFYASLNVNETDACLTLFYIEKIIEQSGESAGIKMINQLLMSFIIKEDEI